MRGPSKVEVGVADSRPSTTMVHVTDLPVPSPVRHCTTRWSLMYLQSRAGCFSSSPLV